jgi:hypothetical protein
MPTFAASVCNAQTRCWSRPRRPRTRSDHVPGLRHTSIWLRQDREGDAAAVRGADRATAGAGGSVLARRIGRHRRSRDV